MPNYIPLLQDDKFFLATITLAYLRKKKAVLIFCPSRRSCQDTALLIA